MQTELIIALTGAGLAVAAMIWISRMSFNSQFQKEKTKWDKRTDAMNMAHVVAFAKSQNEKSMTAERIKT